MKFLASLGLKSKNPDTRRETIQSVAESGDARLLPNLYPLLKDEDLSVRKAAAQAIATFRDYTSVPPLCDALDDGDPSVRVAVLAALEKINDPTIARQILPLLQDTEPAVQTKAAAILERLRWKPTNPEEQAISLVASGRLEDAVLLGSVAVEPLTRLLRSSLMPTRKAAIEMLARIADARGWKAVAQCLKDESPEVRAAAAESLRRVRDIRIFDALAPALHDPEESMRCAVVSLLGEQGSNAVPLLMSAVADPSPTVRAAVAQALGKLRDTRATQVVGGLVTDSAAPVRIAAIHALGNLGDASASEFLVAALQDEPEVQSAALEVLQQLGSTQDRTPSQVQVESDASLALPKLQMLRSVDEVVPAQVEERDDELDISIQPLVRELKSPDASIRFRAVKDLRKTGDPAVCRPLERVLTDAAPPVRRAAAEALAALPWTPSSATVRVLQSIIVEQWDQIAQLGGDAVEPITGAWPQLDALNRRKAAEVLGQVGDPRATDLLIGALASVDAGVRKASVNALAAIGDIVAIEGIRKATTDPVPHVREAALNALQQFGITD